VKKLTLIVNEFRKISPDITANQMLVLLHAGAKPGIMQKELSAATDLADGTISRICALMSDRGHDSRSMAPVYAAAEPLQFSHGHDDRRARLDGMEAGNVGNGLQASDAKLSRKRATCAARGSPLRVRRNRKDSRLRDPWVRKRWRDLPDLRACTLCFEGGYGHGLGSYPPSSARHSRDTASRSRPRELPSGQTAAPRVKAVARFAVRK
jgi:hypothetical protein